MRKSSLSKAFPLLIALSLLMLAGALPCAALTPAPGEGISLFSTDLTLRNDTSIDVTEDFVVHSEETYFKWGLIRYLPINSDARWDKRFGGDGKDDTGIRVKILEVTEDGAPISYDQGSGAAYAQLRIGAFDVPLSKGNHRIVIRYTVEDGLRLLADRDELYWNVLGHYWRFPIENVSVSIHFPLGMPIDVVRHEGYTGRRGVNFSVDPVANMSSEELASTLRYHVSRLGPAQSLSIILNFPKGFVSPPRMGIFTRNRWLFASPILICLYYLIVWIRIGPEPALGSVPVRYEPPAGLSPAAVRYVRTTGCDGRTLAAVLAQLAARGCVTIQLENGEYKIKKQNTDSNLEKSLALEEARVLELLFRDGSEMVLRSKESRNLNTYLLGILGEVQKVNQGKYFTWNGGYIFVGYLLSLVFAMSMALTATGRDTTGILFMTWWFFFCGSIVGALTLMVALPSIQRAIRGLGGAREVLPVMAAIVPFGLALGKIMQMFATNVSPSYSIVMAALVMVNVVCAPALKRMTPLGRQATRDIEGFRLFLEKVEQDPMQRLNEQGEPLRAVGEFVPYAIALEVKEAWGDHLTAQCYPTPTTR